MKKLFVLSIYLLLAINVMAQVPSNIYSTKEKVFRVHPQFLLSRATAHRITMPSFDVSRLIKEDEQVKGKDVPYRFGKGFNVNISLNDGIWSKADSGSVWSFSVASPGAYSLNFILDTLYLPQGAKLYIFNDNGTMIYGPVTARQNITNGLFLTDLIKGDIAVFHLFEPANVKGESRLHIVKVVHAYRNLFKSLDMGTSKSGSCEKDVACYPDWVNESNAIAMVLLSSGNALCSGSILNNTAQDYRAYFLTAFHCIDLNEDGSISSTEKNNAENWAFRFRYRTTTCGGSTVENYFTYNRDNFRAAWNTSDFALVELINTPLYDPRVAFLGWDRTGYTPTKGTGIHHPSGDVMKISFDYDGLSETSYGSNNGTNYWKVDWDIGATEPGSSGSPLFDQNKKVIGQLRGGYSACGNSDMRDWYGGFYHSWTGGGNDITRLSNWLDPNNTGDQVFNTTYPYITGPSTVCTTNSTFTLNDRPPGTTVNWINSSNLTYVSGQGTDNYAVQAANSSVSGMGWVKAIVNSNCGNDTIEKDVWVGKPAQSTITGNSEIGCERNLYVANPGFSNSYNSVQWSVAGPLRIVGPNGGIHCTVQGTKSGMGWIYFTTTNTCGSSRAELLVEVDCWGFNVYPNPTSSILTIESVQNNLEKTDNTGIKEVSLYDKMMKPILHKQFKGKSTTLNVSRLKPDVYLLKIKTEDKVFDKKITVSRK